MGLWKRKIMYYFTVMRRNPHMFVTYFIVSKNKKHLMDFHTKSHRIDRLCIKGKFFKYSIICVLFPTENKDKKRKIYFMMCYKTYIASVQ